MPPLLSRALLRDGTRRLSELMPAVQAALPACFDGLEVIAADAKKIKNATARLKPTRGFKGALLGAKALVALNLRGGLAIAISDSLDGFTNDVPLVPELPQQVRAVKRFQRKRCPLPATGHCEAQDAPESLLWVLWGTMAGGQREVGGGLAIGPLKCID